jgi:hypothetical protein
MGRKPSGALIVLGQQKQCDTTRATSRVAPA